VIEKFGYMFIGCCVVLILFLLTHAARSRRPRVLMQCRSPLEDSTKAIVLCCTRDHAHDGVHAGKIGSVSVWWEKEDS
jgi:hypothetical protein